MVLRGLFLSTLTWYLSLCFYHTFTWHWSFLSHPGSLLSAASPRLFRGGFSRSFHFQPVFLKYFPGFPSDNRILTRSSWGFLGVFLGFSWDFLISTAFPRIGLPTSSFYGLYRVFISTHWIHTGSTFHISPGHIRGGLQTTGFPLFFTFLTIRSMSAERVSIKRLVKITQSCSIFNSPWYNPLFSKTYYNNSVFFLSTAYPRRAWLPKIFLRHN